jgi:mono/diheme cytochrome c family protein
MPKSALAVAALSFAAAGLLPAAELSKSDLDFFDQKIRPIFTASCYSCHSHESGKIKGGLVVDSRDGLLKGGDSGPAVIPGDVAKSLLIKAVRHTDKDLAMPPKEQLTAQQIADLEAWVKMGAPDPRVSKVASTKIDLNNEQVKNHWAYKPVQLPAIPEVKNKAWVKSPVDNFILARQEAKGIKPSALADKQTLIRRATYDLTGLPPTPQEVNAFLVDKSPEAFARLVDRLLASPRYGERWARHWLDVARYADTKGERAVRNVETRFPYAYTYRDYVINAFNQDLPYNQFILEQIAADKLPAGKDRSSLAALGFLTVGKRFMNSADDVIDDRIDVVTRGLMGMTVACARCHDHKFDPIPTKDYYSLHGVFNSSVEPDEGPLLRPVQQTPQYADYLKELAKAEAALESFRADNVNSILANLRKRASDYMLAVHDVENGKNTGNLSKPNFYRQRELDPTVSRGWEAEMRQQAKKPEPVFAPWVALATLKDDEFAAKAQPALESVKAKSNPLVFKALSEGGAPKSMKEAAERYGRLFQDVDKEWQDALASHKKTAGPDSSSKLTALPEEAREELRLALYDKDSPANVDVRSIRQLTSLQTQGRENAVIRRVNEVKMNHPGSPDRAMVMEDVPRPRDSFVYVRGDRANRGPVVPRQFMEIIAGTDRKPFTQGSGRLELAKAIADPKNPFTARVMVNRIWLDHFGSAIVPTPSDFGLRSEPPTHPELLDYLASRFVADGWSIKKLHRLIMLSAVYQQKSDDNKAYADIDPGNALLWKMNRRRLDFESIRDTLLAVGGNMDAKMGGRPVDLTTEPFATRRAVYGFVDRLDLPDVFLAFDFANPEMTSAMRYNTTVPQQALFMMNSHFVIEQAKTLAQRPEFKSVTSDEQRVKAIYQVLYQRAPDAEELFAGVQYLKEQNGRKTALAAAESPWKYGYGSIDLQKKQLRTFNPLKGFAKDTWEGPKKVAITLDAQGGKTPAEARLGAVRRWVAPDDGVVTIDGALSAKLGAGGKGVVGRVISSTAGELAKWTTTGKAVATPVARVAVKRGDTIDFLVTSLTDTSEAFAWAPVINLADVNPNEKPSAMHEWNAQAQFSGPPEPGLKGLEPLEKYAQVLLLTNELVFVN